MNIERSLEIKIRKLRKTIHNSQ